LHASNWKEGKVSANAHSNATKPPTPLTEGNGGLKFSKGNQGGDRSASKPTKKKKNEAFVPQYSGSPYREEKEERVA